MYPGKQLKIKVYDMQISVKAMQTIWQALPYTISVIIIYCIGMSVKTKGGAPVC